MEENAEHYDQLSQKLNAYIQDNGLKNTRQRQVIFDAFVKVEGHVSVDELLERVQELDDGIGHATVYRTMKLFTDAGVAQLRNFGDNQALYEPTVIGEHHDHLICKTCGHIFEFEDELIERRQAEVANARGLRIVAHHHELHGECMEPATCEHRKARIASS